MGKERTKRSERAVAETAAKRRERLHLNPRLGSGDTRETGDSSEREFWFLGKRTQPGRQGQKGRPGRLHTTRKVGIGQGLRSNRGRGATGNGGQPGIGVHHWLGQGVAGARSSKSLQGRPFPDARGWFSSRISSVRSGEHRK